MRDFVTNTVALHDSRIVDWRSPEIGVPAPPSTGGEALDRDLLALVEAEHFANFTIWKLEDEARRRDVADAHIATVKRAIDPWNQRRNDLMEAIDSAILERLAGVDVSGAELHSETAGMIVDRLSVLALKIASMDRVGGEAAAAAARDPGDDESSALAMECAGRAKVLREQRADLAACLERLLAEFAAGRRRFKSYRQLKAYNDPRLNPALRGGAGR